MTHDLLERETLLADQLEEIEPEADSGNDPEMGEDGGEDEEEEGEGGVV